MKSNQKNCFRTLMWALVAAEIGCPGLAVGEINAESSRAVTDSSDDMSIAASVTALQLRSRESPAIAFNNLLERHYDSCQRVFTGNGKGYDRVDREYMAALGLNFLRQSCLCKESPVKEALVQPPVRAADVLSQKHFKMGDSLKGIDDEDKRLVHLYSILFTLGQRESSGNFAAGKDVSANWAERPEKKRQWEAGVFQASADSLELESAEMIKSTKGTKALPKKIFMNYLRALAPASKSDRQLMCDLNVISGSKDSAKTQTGGSGLQSLFAFFGTCRSALTEARRVNSKNPILGLSSRHDATIDCFRSLQQECPAFAIEYAAVVTRINRRHWGPLLTHDETKVKRPYLVPACSKFFRQLAMRKTEFCELNNSSAEIPPAPKKNSVVDSPSSDSLESSSSKLKNVAPLSEGENHNQSVIDSTDRMPAGKGYSLESPLTIRSLLSSIKNQDGQISVDPSAVNSGNCATATYMAFMGAVAAQQADGLTLSTEAAKAMMPDKDMRDGFGVWGRWNANGPGVAVLFNELQLGKNFLDPHLEDVPNAVSDTPQKGDFVKMFWVTGKGNGDLVGAKERGHLGIFTRYILSDTGQVKEICFWSASRPGGTNNFKGGFGEKCLPRHILKHAIFSRLENPKNLNRATTLKTENTYLSRDMRDGKDHSFQEALKVSGIIN